MFKSIRSHAELRLSLRRAGFKMAALYTLNPFWGSVASIYYLTPWYCTSLNWYGQFGAWFVNRYFDQLKINCALCLWAELGKLINWDHTYPPSQLRMMFVECVRFFYTRSIHFLLACPVLVPGFYVLFCVVTEAEIFRLSSSPFWTWCPGQCYYIIFIDLKYKSIMMYQKS